MVNNGLGDTTGEVETRTVEASGAVTAGDIVAIKQDASEGRRPVVAQAQDDTSPNIDQVAGVALEDIGDGETGTVAISGSLIANVATGINQGERLDAGTTAGQAVSSDGGPLLALSGEGETDTAGTALAANEAEVYL